ncbi:MAG: hypothetical protein RPT25_09840 [Cycloclasticus sp.]|jgi:HNH endonuclease.
MKLNVDLSGLWSAVDKMGASRESILLEDIWSDDEIEFDRELSSGGVEISLKDLDSTQGLLSARGRHVVLFIPDHSFRVEQVMQTAGEGNRFHVADCSTLDTMRRRNRFERYRVTNSITGKFFVFGTSKISREKVEGEAHLSVCKNCLNMLNYKGADTRDVLHRNMLVAKFNLPEFFSTYSSVFSRLPRHNINDGEFGYPDDWDDISKSIREDVQYECQSCGVDLKRNKRLLHVHHLNGDTSDSTLGNLVALCADCHRKEPYHGHMMVSRKDMMTLTRLRTSQVSHKIDDWPSVSKLADPALSGVLDYCRRKNWTAPIVGYEMASPKGETIGELELAWPLTRVGVSLGEPLNIDGWAIYNLKEALEKFQ